MREEIKQLHVGHKIQSLGKVSRFGKGHHNH